MSRLAITYEAHGPVRELVERLVYCAERVSIEFDGWEESHVKGPGLYFAVVSDCDYGTYADPMGNNQWPRDACASAYDEDALAQAAETVSVKRDGGIVVAVDGEIESQMVRFRDPGIRSEDADLVGDVSYEPWMGSRHMSAIETSVRPEVIATVTLSEETGRVSVFRDGEAESMTREKLGGPWRAESN